MTAEVIDLTAWRVRRAFQRAVQAGQEARRYRLAFLAQRGMAECEGCRAEVELEEVRLNRCPSCASGYEAYLIETAAQVEF